MKYFIAFLSLAVCLGACETPNSKNPVPPETAVQLENVDAPKFKRAIEEGDGIILDVRTPEEVAAKGYIQNASLLDFYDPDFFTKVNLMSKEKDIYLYCASGGRSIEVVQMLKESGFGKIYHLEKGLVEWEREGFGLVKEVFAKDEKIEELSLEEFESMLALEDRPILIDFHTVWCAPCRKMAPVIDQLEVEIQDKAIVKRIDLDRSKEVGKAYEIQGVPVFIIFKGGKEIWRHNGIISKEALIAQIDKL
jgi:thioredoxin